MNKLIVSLLLTVGISGIAHAAGEPVKPGDAAAGRQKPPYVAPVMARMATAWHLTFQNWQARVNAT